MIQSEIWHINLNCVQNRTDNHSSVLQQIKARSYQSKNTWNSMSCLLLIHYNLPSRYYIGGQLALVTCLVFCKIVVSLKWQQFAFNMTCIVSGKTPENTQHCKWRKYLWSQVSVLEWCLNFPMATLSTTRFSCCTS